MNAESSPFQYISSDEYIHQANQHDARIRVDELRPWLAATAYGIGSFTLNGSPVAVRFPAMIEAIDTDRLQHVSPQAMGNVAMRLAALQYDLSHTPHIAFSWEMVAYPDIPTRTTPHGQVALASWARLSTLEPIKFQGYDEHDNSGLLVAGFLTREEQ